MKNVLLVLSVIIVLFSSCVTRLTPALGGNTFSYLPKPTVIDSSKSKIYIMGEYINSGPTDGFLNFNIGKINISKGHLLKNINFAYGGFLYLGDARYRKEKLLNLNRPSPFEDFNKSLFGYGINTSLGYHIVSDNERITFRVLSWDSSYNLESGDYADFRDDIYSKTYPDSVLTVYTTNKKEFFTTGLSSELLWHKALGSDKLQLGLRIFFGYTPNIGSSYRKLKRGPNDLLINNNTFSISYFLKYNHFFMNTMFSGDQNTGLKLGLGYSF